ncbi:hypothetical protein BDZ89DRAFT_52280 [Hymenopellis radicata]|nr:hypothetical protein BDZ89DRAFT_52280 [Hymenopellis radicata]
MAAMFSDLMQATHHNGRLILLPPPQQPPATQDSLELAGAPAWFKAWNDQQFQPFVARVRGDLTALTRDVATLLVQDGKDRNSKLGDDGPFYEVAFSDGRRPWGAIVAVPGQGNFMLPTLTNTADLQALTLAESYGYYKGYFPHQPVLYAGPTTLTDRIVAIAAAIGRCPRRFVSLSLGT